MPQEQEPSYKLAYKARQAEGGIIDPKVKALPYGSKPIIKGVPQARGDYDRNLIDPFTQPVKSHETKI
jgi:hypothetical protein